MEQVQWPRIQNGQDLLQSKPLKNHLLYCSVIFSYFSTRNWYNSHHVFLFILTFGSANELALRNEWGEARLEFVVLGLGQAASHGIHQGAIGLNEWRVVDHWQCSKSLETTKLHQTAMKLAFTDTILSPSGPKFAGVQSSKFADPRVFLQPHWFFHRLCHLVAGDWDGCLWQWSLELDIVLPAKLIPKIMRQRVSNSPLMNGSIQQQVSLQGQTFGHCKCKSSATWAT